MAKALEPLDLAYGDHYARARTEGIYVSSGGNVVARLRDDAADRTFAVPDRTFLPGRFRVIRKVGTTAGAFLAYEDRNNAWEPHDPGGLVGWFSAKNPGIVVASGRVAYLPDWSGANGVGLAEPTTTIRRPVIAANSWGGALPTLDFNGSCRLWLYDAVKPLSTCLNGYAKPFTVAWAGYWQSFSASWFQCFVSWTDAAPSSPTNSQCWIRLYGSSPYNNLATRRQSPETNSQLLTLGPEESANDPARWIVRFNGSAFAVHKNGSLIAQFTAGSPSGTPGDHRLQANNCFALGASVTNAGATVSGSTVSTWRMGESLVYAKQLADADVSALDAYLAREWPL
jgi:hypothetical protein